MAARTVTTTDYTGSDRRDANGNSGKDWTSLRAWAQAIGYIGIPGAIAIFLVYQGATIGPIIIDKLNALVYEIRENRKIDELQLANQGRIIRLLQRVCSNSAKDDAARQKCFDE